MKEKILKKIAAGNRILYEIIEKQDSPGNVILRFVDDPSNKIELSKSVLSIIGTALIEIAQQ